MRIDDNGGVFVARGSGRVRLIKVGGVDTVIKGGIVYDAKALAAEVRAMVAAEKERAGLAPGPMPIVDFEYAPQERQTQ